MHNSDLSLENQQSNEERSTIEILKENSAECPENATQVAQNDINTSTCEQCGKLTESKEKENKELSTQGKKNNRFVSWIKNHIPTKRKLFQLYSALLFNVNFKGFSSGVIYQGNSKNVCMPGINCYSCPGATTACPLGSLQNAMTNTDRSAIFYIFGIILLYAILAGRWICGWLCPFGLIQELLFKIKTPKLKKSIFTRILSYLKYIILVFFVFIIPIMYSLKDVVVPAFCKYICPAGTLEGAMGLLSNKVNESSFRMLGPIFTWKFLLMVSFIIASIFIFRVFCRFFCPLGALYGLFNKLSIFGIKLEKPKCVDCGLCISKCKMDIRHVGDAECISCGECIDVCPTKAISWKGPKIFLKDNEISEPVMAEGGLNKLQAVNNESNSTASTSVNGDYTASSCVKTKKKMELKKKQKIFKIALYSTLLAILLFAFIYFNFIHKNPELSVDVPEDGLKLSVITSDGILDKTMNVDKDFLGKVTVVNFWGTWCGPCVKELPHFNEVATEYKDRINVVAVHSYLKLDSAPQFIKTYYPNTEMIFLADIISDKDNPASLDIYYTLLTESTNKIYPATIIFDEEGNIVKCIMGSVTKDSLVNEIEIALSLSKSNDTSSEADNS